MHLDQEKPAADLENWRRSPQNQLAFHQLPAEISTARINAICTNSVPFGSSTSSLADFSLRLPSGAKLGLERFLEVTSTDAMIVLHAGKLVFETYRNGMDPSSLHIAMSATKATVGLLSEILATEGAVDLNAPVTRYVPEIEKSHYAGATLRDLLDMRVGYVLSEQEEENYGRATGWQPSKMRESGLKEFFEGLRGEPSECGGPFRYQSANTDLLGWALERATSCDVPSLLSKKLWTPLAAEQHAAITLDRAGLSRSAGGFCATARDFARLGLLVSRNGHLDKAPVFSGAVVDGLIKAGNRKAWSSGQWGESFAAISPHMSYRSGWYTIDGDRPLLFAMGIHGQNLFIDRINSIVIVKFSSWAQPVDSRLMWLTHAAEAEISRCLLSVG